MNNDRTHFHTYCTCEVFQKNKRQQSHNRWTWCQRSHKLWWKNPWSTQSVKKKNTVTPWAKELIEIAINYYHVHKNENEVSKKLLSGPFYTFFSNLFIIMDGSRFSLEVCIYYLQVTQKVYNFKKAAKVGENEQKFFCLTVAQQSTKHIEWACGMMGWLWFVELLIYCMKWRLIPASPLKLSNQMGENLKHH